MKFAFTVGALALLMGCGDGAVHPITAPVAADANPPASMLTNLGWSVELTEFRLAVQDIQFTVEGEEHSRWWPRLQRVLMSTAHAHPGHAGGGEVRGELLGPVLIDWFQPGPLGDASLYPSHFHGFNFSFRTASVEADGLDSDDPLAGHGAYLAGVAHKDGSTVEFDAVLDMEEPQLIGAPFSARIQRGEEGRIHLQLLSTDPYSGATLFDHVDFSGLEANPVQIRPGDDAHNIVRRRLADHSYYAAEWSLQ